MKKLLLIFTLLFSTLMFSTPSYGEWTKVSSTLNGAHTFYVDFDSIRKHGGYVYFWRLRDALKQDPFGDFSSKSYYQGDCKLFRHKMLSSSFHKKPMGNGPGEVIKHTGHKHTGELAEWKHPPPNSSHEIILKRVCGQ